MKKVLMVVLLGVALGVTGCHKHSFNVGTGGNTEADAAYSSWESHWFFGIIGQSEIDVNEICPSGNATIRDKTSFLNGLVAGFVGIIWSPTTVEVYCDNGSANADDNDVAAVINLTSSQMRTIAMDPSTIEFARSISSEKADELSAAINAYSQSNALVASNKTPSSF